MNIERLMNIDRALLTIAVVSLGAMPAARLCRAQNSGSVPSAVTTPSKMPAASKGDGSCFLRRDWGGGWKVAADSRRLYIRVSPWVYELDLASSYPLLQSPWAILTNVGSNDVVCTGLDLRLSVSDRTGAKEFPIVTTLTRLNAQQVTALPKKLQP
jgi:hypothetical protein